MQIDIIEALRIVVEEVNKIIPNKLGIINNKMYLLKDGELISDGVDVSFSSTAEIINQITKNTENIQAISSYLPLKGKNILMLGDSIMGNDRTNGVPDYVAKFTGATVYNGGLGGTRLAAREDETIACIDAPNIVNALVNGDWSRQRECANTLSQNTNFSYFPETIRTLENVNMSEIDIVTLAFGTNDWGNAHTQIQILSALESIIDTIQINFPKVRILVITPIYRFFGTSAASGDSDTVTEIGTTNIGYTLKELALKIEETAKNKRVSVLNAYQEMPLSRNNALTYFDPNDKTHLNSEGNKMYAHIISGKLNSIF